MIKKVTFLMMFIWIKKNYKIYLFNKKWFGWVVNENGSLDLVKLYMFMKDKLFF